MRPARPLRSSAAPGARWPAGGSPRPGSAGDHQGSSGTEACLPWPSGTRSWATPARWRPPPRPVDIGEARVRPCRWVGLPRRIPFARRTRWSVGPEMERGFIRHDSRGLASNDAGACPAERRTNRKIMQTGPTARHSPIGSFQRVCYVVRLHSIAAAASCSERLIDCQPLGRMPFCWHIGGRGRAVYLQRWTATDGAGRAGKS
jgi:hypothetical protein